MMCLLWVRFSFGLVYLGRSSLDPTKETPEPTMTPSATDETSSIPEPLFSSLIKEETKLNFLSVV